MFDDLLVLVAFLKVLKLISPNGSLGELRVFIIFFFVVFSFVEVCQD
jgi:hypothetical protein